MDYMSISGTKPESGDPKVPYYAEAKADGVINPQNYNFNQFKHGKC